MSSTPMRFLAAVLFAFVLSTPAHAIFRAYLASDGSDANPCTLALPCRLLPAALAAVDAGGEIWMLDSANYNSGTVYVTKSVSILAIPGAVGSIVATGSGDALWANTAGTKLSLRNLVFVQLGTGYWGVNASYLDELVVNQCEFANLNNPNGGALTTGYIPKVQIRDTVIRDSTFGIALAIGSNSTLERVSVSNSTVGVLISNSRAVIANSVLAGNNTGLWVKEFSVNAYATVTSTTISGNATGILFEVGTFFNAGDLTLRDSTVTHNTTAFQLTQGVNSVLTLGLDGNVVTDNGTPFSVSGTPTIRTRGNNSMNGNGGGDTIPSPTAWPGQ